MTVPPAAATPTTPETKVKPETAPTTEQATAPAEATSAATTATTAPAADDVSKQPVAASTTDTSKTGAPVSSTPTASVATAPQATPASPTDAEALAVADATDKLGSLILGRADEPAPAAQEVGKPANASTTNGADTNEEAPQTTAKTAPEPRHAAKSAEAVTPPPDLAGSATAIATGPVPDPAPPAAAVPAQTAPKPIPEDTPKVAEATAVVPATTTVNAVVVGAPKPVVPTTEQTATKAAVAPAAHEGQPKSTATPAVIASPAVTETAPATETPAVTKTVTATAATPKVIETTSVAAPQTEQAPVTAQAPAAHSAGEKTAETAGGAAVATVAAAAGATEKKEPTPGAAVAVPAVTEEKKETVPDAAATEITTATPVPAPDVTVANWGTLPASHPLLAFHAQLGDLIKEAGHSKIWGITLDPTAPTFSTLLVLQKYLRSTDGVLATAAKALGITLKWRREFALDGPTPIWDEPHGGEFDGLGYLTHLRHGDDMEVVTWNMYCDVQDLKRTFGDVDKFVRWRVGLMERAMAHLDLAHTTVPIPDYGKGDDPHRMVQVHVYTGMAFLRMDPHVKAAAKSVIRILAPHYPETLSRKLFVGVPRIMNWVYSALTFFVSAATAKKFSPISAEEHTAAALGDTAHVPKRFGGTGPDLADLDRAAALEAKSIEHPAAAAPTV